MQIKIDSIQSYEPAQEVLFREGLPYHIACARRATEHYFAAVPMAASSCDAEPLRSEPSSRNANAAKRVFSEAIICAMLAEPFLPAVRGHVVDTVTASLHLRDFAHAADDALDEAGTPEQRAARWHQATLSLSSAFQTFASCCHGDPTFIGRWNTYLRESSEGEQYLWRHRGKVVPYTEEDERMLGRRGALAKVPAACYAAASGDYRPLQSLEAALDAWVLGIQMIDDLLDWRSDLQRCVYTYPLTRAIVALPDTERHHISERYVANAIWLNGVATRVLCEVAALVELACKRATDAGATMFAAFAAQCVDALNVARRICVDAEGQLRPDPAEVERAVRRSLGPRLQGH
jgi:hypothetical protein